MYTALLVLLFASNSTGTSALPVLRIGQGPRASALGESFAGLADDASAVYWNPAGLASLSDYRVSLSHHQWFMDLTDEVGHAALPLGPGTLGVGLLYSGEPGVEHWSETNVPGDTFATWNGMLAAGYALTLFDRYLFGAAVSGLAEDLHSARGFGAAFDLGGLTRPVPELGLGLAVRHLGRISFPAGPEKLPTELVAGASYSNRNLTGLLDLVIPFDNAVNLRAGIEYAPIKELCLRLGYRTGPEDLSSLGTLAGLTAGLGVKYRNLGLDYALVPYGPLGLTHRIGLSAAFSRAPVERLGTVLVQVIDAETKQPLKPYIVVRGLKDTVATAEELRLVRLDSGTLFTRAILAGYLPKEDTWAVLGDREQRVVIALDKVKYGELRGSILDAATHQPLAGRIAHRGVAFGEQAVGDSGGFRFRNLPAGEYRVGVTGPSEDYIPQSCTLRIETGKPTERDFYLVKKQMTIVLEGINFETGKADILPQFIPILDRAGQILKQTPSIKVELAGHTDPREINTPEFPSNWELSRARAEAVRRYLVDKYGIAPERLIANGYADTQPIAPNTTPEGMARNRRTEFRILEK